jgi:hypothetical protein
LVCFQDQSFLLDARTQSMKSRDKVKVCSTFHGAGLVVPYNRKSEVGYRLIPETVPGLKKIFAKVIETENADEDKKNAAFDAMQELVLFALVNLIVMKGTVTCVLVKKQDDRAHLRKKNILIIV